MFRAISAKARSEYIATQNGWNTDQNSLTKINAALDELKPICEKKIPLLKMAQSLNYAAATRYNTKRRSTTFPLCARVLKLKIENSVPFLTVG